MPILIPPGDERDAVIRDGYAAGRPLREIADEIGVSKTTITKRAKVMGVQSTAIAAVAKTRAATVTRSSRIREKLSLLAEASLDEALRYQQLAVSPEPRKVYNPDSKQWLEIETTTPTARDISDLARAIAALGRTAIDINDRLADDPVAEKARSMLTDLAEAMGVSGPTEED